MGVVASEQFGYHSIPDWRKIFMDEYTLRKARWIICTAWRNLRKRQSTILALVGWATLKSSQAQSPYDDFDQQYRVSYTHREWCKGIKIERKLG